MDANKAAPVYRNQLEMYTDDTYGRQDIDDYVSAILRSGLEPPPPPHFHSICIMASAKKMKGVHIVLSPTVNKHFTATKNV